VAFQEISARAQGDGLESDGKQGAQRPRKRHRGGVTFSQTCIFFIACMLLEIDNTLSPQTNFRASQAEGQTENKNNVQKPKKVPRGFASTRIEDTPGSDCVIRHDPGFKKLSVF
jgi:hypothetical protein